MIRYYTIWRAKNIGFGQTVRMHMLVYVSVVHLEQNQIFSRRRPFYFNRDDQPVQIITVKISVT